MSSSGESDSESEENTKKMFESKINLKEKEANQVIFFKSHNNKIIAFRTPLGFKRIKIYF